MSLLRIYQLLSILNICFSYPDIVVYLLYTTGFVTLEEVKNYKSLQSFKYLTSGWVLEVEWKEYCEERIVLILGKVRHSYAASKSPLRPWVLQWHSSCSTLHLHGRAS